MAFLVPSIGPPAENFGRNSDVWMLQSHKAHAPHHQMRLDPSSSYMGALGQAQELRVASFHQCVIRENAQKCQFSGNFWEIAFST